MADSDRWKTICSKNYWCGLLVVVAVDDKNAIIMASLRCNEIDCIHDCDEKSNCRELAGALWGDGMEDDGFQKKKKRRRTMIDRYSFWPTRLSTVFDQISGGSFSASIQMMLPPSTFVSFYSIVFLAGLVSLVFNGPVLHFTALQASKHPKRMGTRKECAVVLLACNLNV